MKALLCKEFGGPDDLVMEDIPEPTVSEGMVKIEVHSVGLNFPDTLIIAGKYQFKPEFPFAPGMETAGIITEVGAGVDNLKVGDRVMSNHGHGGFAEYVVAPAAGTYVIPDNMPFDQASGFPVTYGTTYHALVDRGNLKKGEVLLVHGAAGGVGLNAVELGKALGATVIGTVGSDEKMDIVRQYGADHVINYSTESIKDRVKELTGGKGADVIYDPVGGDAFDQSMRCINWEGRLLVIGFASGRIAELPTNLTLLKGCSVVGVFWGEFARRTPEKNRANFKTMLDMVERGELKPHVSARFPLEQGGDAMKALLSRKYTGKIAITVKD
ncbi:MAG: NADPH:quinone oxidoreductase family protein [Sneathiella sp.]|nr:NADPH:quinone oxidoreductase family protein [Sneathiella sp.]